MFKKIKSVRLFWFLLVLSFILIITVKFSPLKDIHTSQISYISWFPYGFELGETVFDLSVGYIVSCIFYYIVVYLPEEKKRISAMTILQRRLEKILEFMEITVHYFIYKSGITNDDERLQMHFEKIQTLDRTNRMDFYYQLYEKSTSRTVHCNTGVYTELSLLLDQSNKIQQIINTMFEIPVITSIDHDLVVILEEINNCTLFKGVSMINIYPEGTSPELGKDLFKYYLLYKALGQYIEPTIVSFNQDPVDCWWDLNIIEGKKQYKSL